MATKSWWRVSTFGYKFMRPIMTDKTLVLDARVCQNPYTHGASDAELRARVMDDPKAKALVDRGVRYLQGINGGIVLVGCSYGRHRSVAIADEISRRMQEWNNEEWEPKAPLVGLVGYAQSGKDTFASLLGYRRLAFADKLKELALACDPGLYDGSSLRFKVGEYGWEYVKANAHGAREFLQNLGCGVRDILGEDTWVEAALAGWDQTVATAITDVRFPNEIAAIRSRGGVIVRIDRPGVKPPNNHVSEFAWQAEAPDHLIHNDGDLDALAYKARLLDARLRGAQQ